MGTRREQSEKRRDQRYRAKDRALALISHPSVKLAYHIIDISSSGLAFRYLGETMKDGTISEVNLCYNDRLCVERLAVSSVADRWLGSQLTEIRSRSLRFGELSAAQRQQLARYIEHYTLDRPR